jgi:hypothetical protein
MPKIQGDLKKELLCTRLTSSIREAVDREAQKEGLTASEWLRNLIIGALKERGSLPSLFRFQELDS